MIPGVSRLMTKRLALVGAAILTAGILFGYDQGVISGALRGIEADFDLKTTMIEVVTSFVTLGALVGALVAGAMADRFGRRPAVLFAGVLFIAGALIEAFAPGSAVLVVGRLTVGFAVGVASVAAPLYAAEMAPTRLRGTFVSTYQFGITFGIFVAYLVDEWLQSGSAWRLMLGLSAVAGVLLIVLLLPLRDTPRWYLRAGRPAEAEAELARIHPDDSEARFRELEESLADEPSDVAWREVFARRWRAPLVIGIGLAVFQQITGINAIIYYADKIFAAAGFSSPADQTAATTWAIGAVNVLATLIAITFVDRLGRKPLLVAGLLGMAVAFLSIDDSVTAGASTATASGRPSDAGIIMLVALVVYIASFAFSMGPIVWTMINEIYPRSVRGRAVSVATAANWFSAWIVSQFFLSVVDAVGESVTFWIFAALSVVCLVWIVAKVPETRSRTLEEIEAMWGEDAPPDGATGATGA